MPNFELTKTENARLENLLSLAQIQEGLLNCVTESYKNYIITVVFPRIKVDPKDFAKTIVNLNTGELIVKDDEPVPQNPIKAEVKGGKDGDRGTKPTAEAKH